MSRDGRPTEGTQSDTSFATALNSLFAYRLKTDALGRQKPYTLREVADATGISIGYLSEARRGGIESPAFDKITALAKFFGVRPGYFFGEGDADLTVEQEEVRKKLRTAFADITSLVLRSGAFGPVEEAVLHRIITEIHEEQSESNDQEDDGRSFHVKPRRP